MNMIYFLILYIIIWIKYSGRPFIPKRRNGGCGRVVLGRGSDGYRYYKYFKYGHISKYNKMSPPNWEGPIYSISCMQIFTYFSSDFKGINNRFMYLCSCLAKLLVIRLFSTNFHHECTVNRYDKDIYISYNV